MSGTEEVRPLFGSTGGSHALARFTDQRETYGPLVIEELVGRLAHLQVVADLGAGTGRDLDIVKRFHPQAKLIAVEGGTEYASSLTGKADEVYVANIERDELPLANGQADLIMANQVLEHTKEVFWIFHEVSRSLEDRRSFPVRRSQYLLTAQSIPFADWQTTHAAQGLFSACAAVLEIRHPRFFERVLPWRLQTRRVPRSAVLSVSCAPIARACPCFPDVRIHHLLHDSKDSGVSRRVCHLSYTGSPGNQLLGRWCSDELAIQVFFPACETGLSSRTTISRARSIFLES